jgi:homocysteine S-methyltransferase
MDKEVERYKKKIEGGAQFAFTQPLYELSILEEFLDRTHDCRIPVLLGLLPLQSTRHTEFLHNEVPGITIPADIRKRMAEAGQNGAQEGIAMCRDLLDKAKDMVSGAYLMPSFGRYETVLEVVKGFLTKTHVAM